MGPITWHDAEKHCVDTDGTRRVIYDLAIIYNADVENLVSNRSRQYYYESSAVWIGLARTGHEEAFKWIDGSEPKYTNWGHGAPNNLVIKIYTCPFGITTVVSIFGYAVDPVLD